MKTLIKISEIARKDIDIIIAKSLPAPEKYKQFKIPKRKGGWRKICQPPKSLQTLQKLIIEHVLADLPIHQAATAYRSQTSIYHNALPHKDSAWILKLDFKDFFHSIRPEHLRSILLEVRKDLTDIEIELLNNFLFWKDKKDDRLKLSIGAASSPIISNIVMFEFDQKLAELCDKYEVIYTRYADDLTLSSNDKYALLAVEKELTTLVENTQAPLLELNNKKRVLIGGRKSKRITGVVITHENELSVGRFKRKQVRAMLHLFANHKLAEKDIPTLHGNLAYIKSIEGDFYQSLRDKYDDALFSHLAKASHKISKTKRKLTAINNAKKNKLNSSNRNSSSSKNADVVKKSSSMSIFRFILSVLKMIRNSWIQ